MKDIATLLRWAIAELDGSDSPAVDARTLLAHCLNVSQTYLHTWPEKVPEEAIQARFERLIGERVTGKPVAYLMGYRDFWTLQLAVNESTLIPRPETELLVEHALSLPLPTCARVLDLGTGTGAIALALGAERPDWQIVAVDKSAEAVKLAQHNCQSHHLMNVDIFRSDWFSAVSQQKFDLIVSNPPYIEQDSPWLSRGDVRFEPASALTAGADGLDDIRHIVAQSHEYLNKGAYLALEHGYQQGTSVVAILQQSGYLEPCNLPDLNGLPRVSVGRKTFDL